MNVGIHSPLFYDEVNLIMLMCGSLFRQSVLNFVEAIVSEVRWVTHKFVETIIKLGLHKHE